MRVDRVVGEGGLLGQWKQSENHWTGTFGCIRVHLGLIADGPVFVVVVCPMGVGGGAVAGFAGPAVCAWPHVPSGTSGSSGSAGSGLAGSAGSAAGALC